jgi:prevent-host-death family protein
MTTMRASELRDHLADVVNRVAYGGERIVLERRGKPRAVLVSLEDYALLEALEDKIDIEEATRIQREAREAGEELMSSEEVRRELGL